MGSGLVLPLLIMLLVPALLAGRANLTIDDTSSTPNTETAPRVRYRPTSFWTPVCEDCANAPLAGVDWTQVHNRSLHLANGIADWNMSIEFRGIQIYIFFVIYPSHNSSLEFYLDGSSSAEGQYQRPANTSSSPLYNELVFQSKTLLDVQHTVLVTAPGSTLFSFDYALCTTPDSIIPLPPVTLGDDSEIGLSTSTADGGHTGGSGVVPRQPTGTVTPGPETHRRPRTSSRSLAAALGCSITGIIVLLGLGVWCVLRRRRRQARTEETRRPPNGSEGDESAVVPFFAEPDATERAADVKDAKALFDGDSEAGPDRNDGNRHSAPAAEVANTGPLATLPDTRAYRRLEEELERMQVQYEMLRRVAEPPPYSEGARSSRGPSNMDN